MTSPSSQPSPQPSQQAPVGSAVAPGLSQDSLGSNPQQERLKLLASIVADIDHTYLKQTATSADIAQLCGEAKLALKYFGVGPKSVCVNSSDVADCVEHLEGTDILVCSVVGFPLGKMTTDSKVAETNSAIVAGAKEIDMVINVGALKSGKYHQVHEDIRQVANACHLNGALLKVIIETCNLNDAEKITACQLAESAGADFVKTSTGTEKSGANVYDVDLMRRNVSENVSVKAAGGMGTPEDALAMRQAGAARFGSSGLLKKILSEVGALLPKEGTGSGSY